MQELSTLGYILFFTFLGSIGALVGGVVLLSHEKLALKVSHVLGAFAAGTLLGAAFFDLLPESLELAEKSHTDIFLWTAVGLIVFFLLHRVIHWFHHHHDSVHEEQEEKSATIPLIVIGDTVHNCIDGVVIAATFLVSIPLGVVTTLTVIAHEIPQEIGDFGLLLHKGVSRKKNILINISSASVSLASATITFFLGKYLENYLAIPLAMTAGFFIYIASSDLIPEIHHQNKKGFAWIETGLLILGMLLIAVLIKLLEG